MMFRQLVLVLIICVFVCSAIRQTIYLDIKSSGYSYCFTKLNATDTIGCMWKVDGNVGDVHLMLDDNENSVDQLDPAFSPYVIIMNVKLFSNATFMNALNNNSMITGVIVAEPELQSDRPKYFSGDSKCPNARHSVYANSKGGQCGETKWNPDGNDYFFKKWNFPIILLHKSEKKTLKKIIECSNKHNGNNATDDRRCAIEIKATMNAVKDSRVCLRRNYYSSYMISLARFCDIMFGKNVHFFKTPVVKASNGIILVTVRGSSLSIFNKRALGMHSITPAVIIWAALTSSFSRLNGTSKKQVIFSILDGESINYYGSTKFVDDLAKKNLFSKIYDNRVNLSNIDTIIDLNQLGDGAIDGQFYIHTLNSGKQNERDNSWVKLLQQNIPSGANIKVNHTKDAKLPPSSIQSFLKHESNFSSIVISDYKSQYKNNFYNSFLDDSDRIDKKKLYNLGVSIYKSMVAMVFDDSSANKAVLDEDEFMNIVTCFYNVSRCVYLNEIYFDPKRVGSDMDQSFRLNYLNFLSKVTDIVFYRSGEEVPKITAKDNCKGKDDEMPEYTYRWIPGPSPIDNAGICWRKLEASEKVVFISENDAWKSWNTTEYSYWTRSLWLYPVSVSLFLRPPSRWEYTILSTGVIVLLISVFLIWFALKFDLISHGNEQSHE